MGDMVFERAEPVWLAGETDQRNQLCGFYTCTDIAGDVPSAATLRITAADAYRLWINGVFAGYGPARTAHGYSRVDEWPLAALLQPGTNHVAIDVTSCGIDSYAYAMQPAFLQAEVVVDGQIVAATGASFEAFRLSERVQKVERFSKQRPFAEAYRLTPSSHDWRVGERTREPVPCEEVASPVLLPRHVRLPEFTCVEPVSIQECGSVVERQEPLPSIRHTRRNGVGKRVMGFPIEELEIDMSEELVRLAFAPGARSDGQEIDARGYCLHDFGRIQGGFIGISLSCEEPTRVYLQFDEVRDRGPDRCFVLGVGAVALDLAPGQHMFETIEPYSLRFLRVLSLDASVKVERVWIREYVNPVSELPSPSDDPELAAIFHAGRQTFRTNSVDLFTDCMSRERGGYPCDAFFTARAEHVLAGEALVERNFLENYFLTDSFASIPKGMVPHCYPSDRLGKGQYIPNWGLWLVLQLCVYCSREGDEGLRDLAHSRVDALFGWFAPHRNDQGLLEDLPGWIFVEWSPANECTDAVNHPTNMLYAYCLRLAGALYGRDDWQQMAEQTRAAVRAESWDGRWFVDQSVRVDGALQRGDVRTETCQYHALFCGIASREDFPELWERLRDGWGPLRGMHVAMVGADAGWKRYYDEGVEPRPDDEDLVPAGLLYGLMLRFDLLQEAGEWKRLLREVRRVFGPMARESGTLWEHADPHSSLNHGFAACACEYLTNALTALGGGCRKCWRN